MGGKRIKHKFKCTKCRRTFQTNRGLASHQRAHKKKVPKVLKIESEQKESSQNIAMDTKKNQDYKIKPVLTQLPNINNWMNIANLSDLKNLNLTRLAMPEIKKQQKYQIKKQNVNMLLVNGDKDYKYHCIKCSAAFFYQSDLQKHDGYAECIHRPYLCPFCEKPFKSFLAVKKHCTNMHSSIINWDLVGDLLKFVEKYESADQDNTDYIKLVRKFARDCFLKKLNGENEEEAIIKAVKSPHIPIISLIDDE